MNIALLQLHCRAGHPEHNARLIRKAVEGARIASEEISAAPLFCAAPELALCGAPLECLPHTPGFIARCMKELTALAHDLRNGPPLLLGSPDICPDICPDMPESGEAHEYTTGEIESALYILEGGAVRRLCGRPLAHALHFGPERTHTLPRAVCVICHGHTLAVFQGTPTASLAASLATSLAASFTTRLTDLDKAECLINLDVAPFDAVFWPQRHARLAALAQKIQRPVLRVNPVGGNGSWIFPGGSMTLNSHGRPLTEAAPFRQELVLECLDDLTAPLAADCAPSADAQSADAPPPPWEAAVWDALVTGLRDHVSNSGFTGVILGLSGGMDSALVAALAVEALGPDKVLGVLMPSPWSSTGSVDDSLALAGNLGMTTHTVLIEPLMNAFETALAPAFGDREPDVTEENIQARIRGSLLMAMSNKFGLMLLSTGNKSESAAGYGTLYGDLAGSLSPIVDVFKTEVYTLARWCNTLHDRELIPEAIFTKPPSAELRPGQTDQDSLPPYEALDAFVRAELNGVASDALSPQEAERIRSLLRRSEFKRHQSALPLFVSPCPLALRKKPLPV